MIYVICGPTGSGKTNVANKIAEFLNSPIINADAFQIYKDMDIGTAKLNRNDPNYFRYHLLDVVTPEQNFSVKEYQDLFRKELNNLLKDYKDVVVCGGTGLYIKASLYDYHFAEFDDDISDLEKMTNEELYKLLESLDPEALKSIHINNKKRIIRAISIARSSNQTKSETLNGQKHQLIYKDVRFLMINPDREVLYRNINNRVDSMFEKGLIDEVKNLDKKYKLSTTSKQAIGYKEVLMFLNKEAKLEDCKELIKQRTRNYAKRQWTFFNNQLPVEKYENGEKIIQEVLENGK